jgi:hypothetical protein
LSILLELRLADMHCHYPSEWEDAGDTGLWRREARITLEVIFIPRWKWHCSDFLLRVQAIRENELGAGTFPGTSSEQGTWVFTAGEYSPWLALRGC